MRLMWRVQGQGRQLWICQSLFVSFLSLNRPPLALGRLRRSHLQCRQSERAKEGPISWELGLK